MTSRRRVAIILGVGLLLALVFVPSGVLGADTFGESFNSSEYPEQDPPNVTISVTETEKSEQQLLVSFNDTASSPQPSNSQAVQALKHRANNSQLPLQRFANTTSGITIEKRFWIANTVLVTADTKRVSLRSIAHVQGVERITSNVKVTVTGSRSSFEQIDSSIVTETDPITSSPTETTYGLEQINAPTAWNEYNTRGEGVKVAILDSGVDVSHPDIDLYTSDSSDPTYPGGWVAFDGNGNRIDGSEPNDPNGHGTHVSGTVVGGDASDIQIGVAPEASLMHAKVVDDNGDGNFSQILSGMQWAVEHDAAIIGMSIGAEGYHEDFIEPIENARSAGVVVIAAIGNEGEGPSISPGNIYDALSIGATDSNTDVPAFSGGETIDTSESWGSKAPAQWPDEYVVPVVVAPGYKVLSAYPGTNWSYSSGTSMAQPHVAGSVALVQAGTSVDHSPSNLTTALTSTAWKPDGWNEPGDERDTRYGFGIIDTGAAIAYLRGDTAEPNLQLRSADLNTTSILEGDAVRVTGSIENTGTATGTFTAGLRIDGTVTKIKSTTVSPGGTTSIVFEPSFESRGQYSLAVNDTPAGTLQVDKPATIELLDASLEKEVVVVNESANVTLHLENSGDRDGTVVAGLEVNRITESITSVSVPAQSSVNTTVTHTFSTPGNYNISINGTQAGKLTVVRPANLTLVNSSLVTERVRTGDEIIVSVTVENSGGVEGTYTAQLEFLGVTHSTVEIPVQPGAVSEGKLSTSFRREGKFPLTVNGKPVGNVTVSDAMTPTVINTSLNRTSINSGEAVEVTGWIENTEAEKMTFQSQLSINGGIWAEQTLTLEAGEKLPVNYTISLVESGNYTFSIDGVVAGNLTVNADWAATYTASDRVVYARGLNTAVNHYLKGELSPNRLNSVVHSYLSGEKL